MLLRCRDFELKDAQGSTLALIDRNFSGFGRELFTGVRNCCVLPLLPQPVVPQSLACAPHAPPARAQLEDLEQQLTQAPPLAVRPSGAGNCVARFGSSLP